MMLDDDGDRMEEVKSIFETTVLNNSSNTALTNHLFYLIQKCKAALGMYESAMSGFQQIVNQNPYSYEALLAGWDYAATSLLLNSGGTGGGESEESELWNFGSSIERLFDDPNDRYDKKLFSKEDRKKISVNVTRSFEEIRRTEIENINRLQEKANNGDRSAAKELQTKKALGDVVKTQRPSSSEEHIRNVNGDIKKIFNSEKLQMGIGIKNLIPTAFELYQNFPNPFNPSTKIKFDLPQSAKVTLKIYDILARELTKIVNNSILEAGVHTYDFNASSLASGVYFYRIESIDPGSNNIVFVKTKKMAVIR